MKNRSGLCNCCGFSLLINCVLSVIVVFVSVLVVVLILIVVIVVLILIVVLVFVVVFVFVIIHFYHPVLICAKQSFLYNKNLFNIRPYSINIFICDIKTLIPLCTCKS